MKGIFSKGAKKNDASADPPSEVLHSDEPKMKEATNIAQILKEQKPEESAFNFNFSMEESSKSKKKKKNKKKKKSESSKLDQEESSDDEKEPDQLNHSSQLGLVNDMESLTIQPSITEKNSSKAVEKVSAEKETEDNTKRATKTKKKPAKTENKKTPANKVDDDLAFLDSLIAENEKELQEQKKQQKKKQKEENATAKGPKFIVPSDPSLKEDEKLLRKFGKGKNLVSKGPTKVKDPNWLGDQEETIPSTNEKNNEKQLNKSPLKSKPIPEKEKEPNEITTPSSNNSIPNNNSNGKKQNPAVMIIPEEEKIIRPPLPPGLSAPLSSQSAEKIVYHHSPFTFSFGGL
jgi:hypothetical protein